MNYTFLFRYQVNDSVFVRRTNSVVTLTNWETMAIDNGFAYEIETADRNYAWLVVSTF